MKPWENELDTPQIFTRPDKDKGVFLRNWISGLSCSAGARNSVEILCSGFFIFSIDLEFIIFSTPASITSSLIPCSFRVFPSDVLYQLSQFVSLLSLFWSHVWKLFRFRLARFSLLAILADFGALALIAPRR